MALKDNIRTARLQNKLTQEELGNKIGVKKQTIQKYENGIITNIPSDKVEAIATALGTTPAYLMGWEEEVQQSPSAREQMLQELDGVQFALYSETQDLTDEQLEDVIKFVRFLKTQGKDK